MALSADAAERHAAVARAIDAIRAGGMVILVDDEDRENEGDLVMAADLVTPEAINFMAREGRGLICLSLTEERVAQLGLTMMAADNRSPRHTAFTVSIDGRHGITTGISARERAETVRVAVARDARPDDIVTPGHIFPLKARRGGVLVRSGHTEGSVDLARLAGHEPAGVICEIMRADGEMARMPDLQAFARTHALPVVTIADLIDYRLGQEILVHPRAETCVRPRLGGVSSEFRACVYTTDVEETEYLALVLGDIKSDEPVLVRVQSADMLRDVFGVGAADSDHPATVSLRMIEEAGKGIMLYVYSRARTSLLGRLGDAPSAAAQQARLRDFGLGAQVLAHLGARTIRLLTNRPRPIVGLGGYGLEVIECVPIQPPGRVVAFREATGTEGKERSS
jgi:3,4-dihydroxy 2-butanone 4-phosphate synthase / GTP cyclohydrolase II